MIVEGVQGPSPLAAGASHAIRLGSTSEVSVADALARYYEAVRTGNVFAVADQSGKTMPAGLSASPTTVTLYNPKGSGVNAAILYASLTSIVAWGAGAIVWLAANTNVAAAAVTGTAGLIRNCKLGNAKQSAILAFTAATLPAAPEAICVLGAGLTGAITTAPGLAAYTREFAGSLVLGPGSALSFQSSTASGASGAAGEFIWQEIPELT